MTPVLEVLRRIRAAIAAGDAASLRSAWVPLPNTAPEGAGGASLGLPGATVTLSLTPDHLLEHRASVGEPDDCHLTEAAEAAWAICIETLPGSTTVQALYQLVQLDGAWLLAARIGVAFSAAGAPASPPPVVPQAQPAVDPIRRFYAAYLRADAAAGESVWVHAPWAFSATVLAERRGGALVHPFALTALGAEEVLGEQRILWRSVPHVEEPEVLVGLWPQEDVAWALVREGGRAGNRLAAFQLVRLRSGAWRIDARIQFCDPSAPARPPAPQGRPAGAPAPQRTSAGSATSTGSPAHPPHSIQGVAQATALNALARAADRIPRPGPVLAAAAAVACGVLGQLAYSRRPPDIAAGTLWFLLGIAAFSLPRVGLRASSLFPPEAGAEDQPPRTRPGGAAGEKRHIPRRAVLAGAFAGVLTAAVLASVTTSGNQASFALPLALWLASIALALAGARLLDGPLLLPRPSFADRPRQDRWLAIGLGALLAVSLAVRLWQLGQVPPTLGGDEGSQGVETLKVLRGAIRNPFSTGWLGVPTMSFFFNALTVGPLGNTAAALRLPWALIGSATVVVVFFLVRRLCGAPVAWITALLLATYHFHVHFSRLGSNQVADPLFVAVALLALHRGLTGGRALDWAVGGVTVGVAQYFYAGARFTGLIVLAVLAYHALRERPLPFWRRHRTGVIVLAFAGLVTAAPMIQYALRHPDAYNARLNSVGIIQSGWLEREQGIRQQGAFPILVDQLQRAALAFNAYPDRTFWYGSPRPLFQFVPAILFLLGLGYATFRLLDRRFFPLVAWWWGAVITGGMLTESPPSSMRLITLAPPAVFFVSLSLVRLTHLLQQLNGGRPLFTPTLPGLRSLSPTAASTLVPGAAALALAAASLHYYFAVYTPLRVYGNPTAVIATELATYAKRELGPDSQIIFFGAPRMYVDFGTIPYLVPEIEGFDVREPLRGPPEPTLVRQGKWPVFVFLPERRAELELVRRTFPNGQATDHVSPAGRIPLFTIYSLAETP